MLPDFVEGHFHATSLGIMQHGFDLQTDSLDELLGKLEEYTDAHPDIEFISGRGVRPDTYGPGEPTAAMLNAIVPDRPIYLIDPHGIHKVIVLLTMTGGVVRYGDGT